MRKEKFQASWWENVWLYGIGGVILIFLGYKERGFDSASLQGVGILLLLILFLVWSQFRSYLEIRDLRELIIRGQLDFGHTSLDIFSIKYIRRTPAFLLKTWGSFIVIYVTDQEGKLKHSTIREKNYTKNTIKGFLKRITDINPHIDLDPEYQDLLAGKYDDGIGYFTMTPAKRSLFEVEKELGLR
jgi:hypothetical protein